MRDCNQRLHPRRTTKIFVYACVLCSLGVVLSVLLSGAMLLYIGTHPEIKDVSIDNSSVWGKYFLSESGFPVIRISREAGSRKYTDRISFVGKDRPLIWFEEMGFEIFLDKKQVVSPKLATGFIPDDGKTRRIVFMFHPKAENECFSYLPDIGLLFY